MKFSYSFVYQTDIRRKLGGVEGILRSRVYGKELKMNTRDCRGQANSRKSGYDGGVLRGHPPSDLKSCI